MTQLRSQTWYLFQEVAQVLGVYGDQAGQDLDANLILEVDQDLGEDRASELALNLEVALVLDVDLNMKLDLDLLRVLDLEVGHNIFRINPLIMYENKYSIDFNTFF